MTTEPGNEKPAYDLTIEVLDNLIANHKERGFHTHVASEENLKKIVQQYHESGNDTDHVSLTAREENDINLCYGAVSDYITKAIAYDQGLLQFLD